MSLFNIQSEILCDVQIYGDYETVLSKMVAAVDPLLDAEPFKPSAWAGPTLTPKLRNLHAARKIMQTGDIVH